MDLQARSNRRKSERFGRREPTLQVWQKDQSVQNCGHQQAAFQSHPFHFSTMDHEGAGVLVLVPRTFKS